MVEEFVEVESGKNNGRPELAKALDACRIYGATLIVAKLDRLARNAAFLLNLQEAGVDFIAADMPQANRLTVGILAMVAEDEARRISQRTKDALAAAKARGVQLGNPANLSNEDRRKGSRIASDARQKRASKRATLLSSKLAEIRSEGATSLRQIAAELNSRGIRTARGGQWRATQVKRLLERIEAQSN